jgi:type I restriction enzyme, S subunit
MRLEACSSAPHDWKDIRIVDACARITSGGTPSRKVPAYYSNGAIPWVKTKELMDGFIFETEEAITADAVEKSSAKILPMGTILLAMYGATVGMLGILGRDMACNQACCALIPKRDFSRDFLYYQLLAHRQQLQGMATGAAQQNLSGQQIKELVLPFPSYPEQEAIGCYLRSLDDRIALLRETNATLEAIAQALFKSWFVDFDPVRAKQEGRAPEGMDEATATLFPDSFEESALGLVPVGWRWSTLADAYEINPPRKLKKGEVAPYLDMANVPTAGHCAAAIIQREMGSGAKFRNGDTLLARITPCLENGKSAFVDFLQRDETGWGSTEFVVLRPKEPLPEYHAYLLCRHSAFREFAVQSMSGTSGRQRVQNDVLGRYLLVVATDNVASAFASVVVPIQTRIAANHEQAQTLATLRETLLPRLISGQLRLPEAAQAIQDISEESPCHSG